MGLRIARRAWIKWINPQIFHPQNFGRVTYGGVPEVENVIRTTLSSSQLKPQQIRLYSTLEDRTPQFKEDLGMIWIIFHMLNVKCKDFPVTII